jgi:hypothetical protein
MKNNDRKNQLIRIGIERPIETSVKLNIVNKKIL